MAETYRTRETMPAGVRFRRRDGTLVRTTGRSAPLFYDVWVGTKLFKHEVRSVEDPHVAYFADLDQFHELWG